MDGGQGADVHSQPLPLADRDAGRVLHHLHIHKGADDLQVVLDAMVRLGHGPRQAGVQLFDLRLPLLLGPLQSPPLRHIGQDYDHAPRLALRAKYGVGGNVQTAVGRVGDKTLTNARLAYRLQVGQGKGAEALFQQTCERLARHLFAPTLQQAIKSLIAPPHAQRVVQQADRVPDGLERRTPFQRVCTGGLFGAAQAQQGVDGGEQFYRLYGLDEIAVGPAFQSLRFVRARHVAGAQVQDGDRGQGRVALDAPTHFQPADVGQLYIQQNQIGTLLRQLQGFLARSRLPDIVAGFLQGA